MLWLKAPIIIKSNRERITLNYIQAQNFAKILNTFLVRQPCDTCKWERKPNVDQIDQLYENIPAYQEIFVYNAPFYLDDTICKRRKL